MDLSRAFISGHCNLLYESTYTSFFVQIGNCHCLNDSAVLTAGCSENVSEPLGLRAISSMPIAKFCVQVSAHVESILVMAQVCAFRVVHLFQVFWAVLAWESMLIHIASSTVPASTDKNDFRNSPHCRFPGENRHMLSLLVISWLTIWKEFYMVFAQYCSVQTCVMMTLTISLLDW